MGNRCQVYFKSRSTLRDLFVSSTISLILITTSGCFETNGKPPEPPKQPGYHNILPIQPLQPDAPFPTPGVSVYDPRTHTFTKSSVPIPSSSSPGVPRNAAIIPLNDFLAGKGDFQIFPAI